MHPFLGAFCPILIVSDIRLEFIDPALCSSQLIRKFLSGLSCCLEVCLRIASRAVNQRDNGIACPVHYIGCPVHYIGFRIFCFGGIRNSRCPSICNLANGFRRISSLTSHRVPLTSTASDISASQSELNFGRFDAVDNPLWLLSKDEARRIAANIAKLPGLLSKPDKSRLTFNCVAPICAGISGAGFEISISPT